MWIRQEDWQVFPLSQQLDPFLLVKLAEEDYRLVLG